MSIHLVSNLLLSMSHGLIDAFAPAILSGYEVNEYIKNQTNELYFKYGLLENYAAFVSLFVTLIAIKLLFAILSKERNVQIAFLRFSKTSSLKIEYRITFAANRNGGQCCILLRLNSFFSNLQDISSRHRETFRHNGLQVTHEIQYNSYLTINNP